MPACWVNIRVFYEPVPSDSMQNRHASDFNGKLLHATFEHIFDFDETPPKRLNIQHSGRSTSTHSLVLIHSCCQQKNTTIINGEHGSKVRDAKVFDQLRSQAVENQPAAV